MRSSTLIAGGACLGLGRSCGCEVALEAVVVVRCLLQKMGKLASTFCNVQSLTGDELVALHRALVWQELSAWLKVGHKMLKRPELCVAQVRSAELGGVCMPRYA